MRVIRRERWTPKSRCWWHLQIPHFPSLIFLFELTTYSSYSELPAPCCVLCSRTHLPAPVHASSAEFHPWHSSVRAPVEGPQMSPAFPPPWARSWIFARSAGCCHCWASETTETKMQERNRRVNKIVWIEISIFPRHDVASQPFNFTNTHTKISGAMLLCLSLLLCVFVHSKWKYFFSLHIFLRLHRK